MKLNTLKPAEGSTQSRKRIGRGPGSGLGGTSTRGSKGAKSRSGYARKIGDSRTSTISSIRLSTWISFRLWPRRTTLRRLLLPIS